MVGIDVTVTDRRRRRSNDRPLQGHYALDNVDMTPSTDAFLLESTGQFEPFTDTPVADLDPVEVDLHLVDPGRRERAGHQQQRRAFQARCHEIADHLVQIRRFEDWVEFYRLGVVSRLELTTAAALYPELMPTLNGEWEWIAITIADLEDV